MDQKDFAGKDFLTLMDFTQEEITHILDTAADFKSKLQRGESHAVLSGRTAALIFEKKWV
jgi:ornithine carbamoyltransferase